MLGYGKQTIDQVDIDAVVSALKSDYLTQGPLVERFEAEFAERLDAKYAIAVSNGTAGLHLAALAVGASPGKRGLTTSLSFVATANCLLYCGASIGFVDIDRSNLCMSSDALNNYIDVNECDFVITVDFAGLAGSSRELRSIAGSRILIEDACHGLGGYYANGRSIGCGDYSDITVFSFHPVKSITTGEGGMVVTNNLDIANRIRKLRSHGIEREYQNLEKPLIQDGEPSPWYYEQQFLGYNYRLSDLQAALGIAQLSRLDKFIARRREIVMYYDAEFMKFDNITIPQSSTEMRARSALHLYLLQFDWLKLGLTRTRFMRKLLDKNIRTQVHYIPIHLQTFFQRNCNESLSFDLPEVERYYDQCLSLPLYPSMTDNDVSYVIEMVREALNV